MAQPTMRTGENSDPRRVGRLSADSMRISREEPVPAATAGGADFAGEDGADCWAMSVPESPAARCRRAGLAGTPLGKAAGCGGTASRRISGADLGVVFFFGLGLG